MIPITGGKGFIELHPACIREDTGFEPQYDTGRAVADYVDRLKRGNVN